LATDNHKVYGLLECDTLYCGRNSPWSQLKLLPPMNFTNFSGQWPSIYYHKTFIGGILCMREGVWKDRNDIQGQAVSHV